PAPVLIATPWAYKSHAPGRPGNLRRPCGVFDGGTTSAGVLSTHMARTIHVTRSKLATLGVVVVILGGVACSALNSNSPTSSAPQAASALKSAPQPAPAAPGVTAGAPAAGVATDAMQRSATAGGAAAPASSAANSITEQSAPQTLDRMIIRTAQLAVEVTNM